MNPLLPPFDKGGKTKAVNIRLISLREGRRGDTALLLALLGCLLALLAACAPAAIPSPAPDLTQVARQVRETAFAELETTAKAPAPSATAYRTQAPYPTATPYPTHTPYPSPTLAAQATRTSATAQPSPTSSVAFDAFAKNASILVYEDNYNPNRSAGGFWIKDALEVAGYKPVHVKDEIGTFQQMLAPENTWDLILVAEESRAMIDGPFITELLRRMDGGTPVVFETWKTYNYYTGGMAPVLQRCGVTFQTQWDERSELVALVDHPILRQPNRIPILRAVSNVYFPRSPGDALMLLPGSRATLLMGQYHAHPKEYASIVLCQDEMLILQTFLQHNYNKATIMNLWQNYTDYLLRKRFALKR